MKLILYVLISTFLFKRYTADVCQYNFSLAEVNPSYIQQLRSYMFDSVSYPCHNILFVNDYVKFWLYTRCYSTGRQLNSYLPVMPVRKTILLVHGWLCGITNSLMPQLRDTYLRVYDANVIMVDWSYYAAKTYGEAHCHAPYVANTITNFLIMLYIWSGVSIESVHIIGYSIGAQIAGLTGGKLQELYTKKILRITGLDPAGPLYLEKPLNERLDKSDASFVDVIHTNAGMSGYGPRCGNVDYYPQCGTFQAGCPFNPSQMRSLEFIVNRLACDQPRSVEYLIESLLLNKFESYPCPLCPINCYQDNSTMSLMGEYSINNHTDSSYILHTNENSPFGRG